MQAVDSIQEKSWIDRMADEPVSIEDSLIDTDVASGEEDIYVASYLQLMWWRFRKHRMALISAFVIILLYLVVGFAEFVSPYHPEPPNPSDNFTGYKFAPPSRIHIFDEDWNLHRPFVYKLKTDRDPETLRKIYTEDKSYIVT